MRLIRSSNGFHSFEDSLEATSLNQYPMLFTQLATTTTRTEENNNLATFEHFNKAGRFLVWSLLYLFCMEFV